MFELFSKRDKTSEALNSIANDDNDLLFLHKINKGKIIKSAITFSLETNNQFILLVARTIEFVLTKNQSNQHTCTCTHGVTTNDRECGMNISTNKKGYLYLKSLKDGMQRL